MAASSTVVCPVLEDVLASQECLENFAGLGSVVYIGLKDDLEAPLTLTDDTYATPKFKAGKGLFRLDLKDESQKIEGSSQGRRGGFTLTCTLVFEAVNPAIAKISRALNNLDYFLIFPDGDETQIMYDPNRKVKAESDGIKSDTGAAASDERNTTITLKLGPVKYCNLYVTAPTAGGWESLRANKLME